MIDTANLCPGCAYDLRGHDLLSEFCPECGAYLTPDGDETPGRATLPAVVLRKTLQTDDSGILLRNSTLSPNIVTRHLRSAAGAAEVVNIAGIGVLVIVGGLIVMVGMVLGESGRMSPVLSDHPLICFAGMLVVAAVAYRLLVRGWLVRRYIERRVRVTLRSKGHDVCVKCGWCYEATQAGADTCPNCGRAHEAMYATHV